MLPVAVVGCGAIGAVVAGALHAGRVPGAQLAGVVDPRGDCSPALPRVTFEQAVSRAELVVECAGQQALKEIGPAVLDAGKDLLVVSVGALADAATFAGLRDAGPGRVHLSTGAIGGLDLLRSAARMAAFDRVEITTTKLPTGLVQPWMSEEQAHRVRTATSPVEVLRASAREMTLLFPKSTNVAASVALAVGDWDVVEAVVVADPAATLTSHTITAQGPAGRYRFDICNAPSAENPTTSQVVPYAVLRAIGELAMPGWAFR